MTSKPLIQGAYIFLLSSSVARDSGHKPITSEGKERLLSALVLCGRLAHDVLMSTFSTGRGGF